MLLPLVVMGTGVGSDTAADANDDGLNGGYGDCDDKCDGCCCCCDTNVVLPTFARNCASRRNF